jgi:hypothetical protein
LGFLSAVGQSLNAAWAAFGIVTLVFWQMGRVTPHPDFDDDWDPTHLPHLPLPEPATVPRAQSISQAVMLTVYVLWWIGLLPLPQILRLTSWTEQYIPQLAPVWQDVSLAITFVMAFHLMLNLLAVWRPAVPKWRVALQVVGDVAALGIIYYLLQADSLILVPAGGTWAGQTDTINDATRVGLIVLSVLIVLGLVFDEGRRLLGYDPIRRPDGRRVGDIARRARGAALAGSRVGSMVRPTRPPRP